MRSHRTGATRTGPRPSVDLPSRASLRATFVLGGGSFIVVYGSCASPVVDCGQEFVFTAGEQEFYAQRGFWRHPSGVLRVARPARHSATGPGGPGRGSRLVRRVRAVIGGIAAATPSGAPGRCTRRSVPSVVGPRRYRSSPPALGRCIAATASRASLTSVRRPRGRVARGRRSRHRPIVALIPGIAIIHKDRR